MAFYAGFFNYNRNLIKLPFQAPFDSIMKWESILRASPYTTKRLMMIKMIFLVSSFSRNFQELKKTFFSTFLQSEIFPS